MGDGGVCRHGACVRRLGAGRAGLERPAGRPLAQMDDWRWVPHHPRVPLLCGGPLHAVARGEWALLVLLRGAQAPVDGLAAPPRIPSLRRHCAACARHRLQHPAATSARAVARQHHAQQAALRSRVAQDRAAGGSHAQEAGCRDRAPGAWLAPGGLAVQQPTEPRRPQRDAQLEDFTQPQQVGHDPQERPNMVLAPHVSRPSSTTRPGGAGDH
mmetsp:Transcript_8404/g.16749  ORF Transcript_8404/g.16749 Transcript_8404/m.16749 type:complete len:213 (+) Transcript_8404:162-800(+)